jgi:hypothetical protein
MYVDRLDLQAERDDMRQQAGDVVLRGGRKRPRVGEPLLVHIHERGEVGSVPRRDVQLLR